MEPRIDYRKVDPGFLPAVLGLEEYLTHSGLEENLYHLVKLRASQVNGWADCIDMHWKDLRALGETEQRLYGLDAWEDPISNVPGKSLVAVEVSYPPGGASAPHHHSAVVYAYVLSGQIASQVEGQPERIYRAGECWCEMPGAHHLIDRNASNTEPAKLLAVVVADTGDNAVTVPDHEGGSR